MELWKLQRVSGLTEEMLRYGNQMWEVVYRYYGNEAGRKLHDATLLDLLQRNGNLTPQEASRLNEMHTKHLSFQREYDAVQRSFNNVKRQLMSALGEL